MLSFAAQVGPGTAALVETIMRTKPHPEQGFRACLGILQLAKTYGEARLEAACRRGLTSAHHLRLDQIDLQHGLDRAYANEKPPEALPSTRQHPWPRLLPLRKGDPMPTHPTQGRLVTLGLTGMAKALDDSDDNPTSRR